MPKGEPFNMTLRGPTWKAISYVVFVSERQEDGETIFEGALYRRAQKRVTTKPQETIEGTIAEAARLIVRHNWIKLTGRTGEGKDPACPECGETLEWLDQDDGDSGDVFRWTCGPCGTAYPPSQFPVRPLTDEERAERGY